MKTHWFPAYCDCYKETIGGIGCFWSFSHSSARRLSVHQLSITTASCIRERRGQRRVVIYTAPFIIESVRNDVPYNNRKISIAHGNMRASTTAIIPSGSRRGVCCFPCVRNCLPPLPAVKMALYVKSSVWSGRIREDEDANWPREESDVVVKGCALQAGSGLWIRVASKSRTAVTGRSAGDLFLWCRRTYGQACINGRDVPCGRVRRHTLPRYVSTSSCVSRSAS